MLKNYKDCLLMAMSSDDDKRLQTFDGIETYP